MLEMIITMTILGGGTSSNTLGELLVVNEMLNRRWGQERQLVSGGKQIHQSFDIENIGRKFVF